MLLSQLKYFQVVARHEHISKAAEELCIAQPALSVTISKMEKELGVPLFDRQGRNIKLNDAGRRLLVHADFMLEELEELEHSLAELARVQENILTLSVNNTMFLHGWLQQFVLAHPSIQLRQKMFREDQMIDALLDESIDVALGDFAVDFPGITRKILIEDEYVVIIPLEHRLAGKREIYFTDIEDELIISLPSNTIVKIVDKLFAQRGKEPNICFEGTPQMMNKMLSRGRGLLFASRQMLYMRQLILQQEHHQQLAQFDCHVRSVLDLNCSYQLALCWKENRLPPMAEMFVQAMENSYPDYHCDREYMQREIISGGIS